MSVKTLTREGKKYPNRNGSSASDFSAIERLQFERIELARGSWASGRVDNAVLLLDSVKSEEMSPRVAAECYVAEAAFRMELGDREGSLRSLENASPFIDSAPLSIRGAFHHQRARIHKAAGNLDAAFTDYAGAEICWMEIGATDKLGAVVLNLASLSLHLGDLGRAHEFVERAINLFTEAKSFYISQAHDTRAQIFLAEGKIRAALGSINTALSLCGDNEIWQEEFQNTRDRIITALIDLIGEAGFNFPSLQKEMVRNALIKHEGNLTRAGKEVGLTHKGISYIIDHNPELEPLRVERRVKLKSVFK